MGLRGGIEGETQAWKLRYEAQSSSRASWPFLACCGASIIWH
jgi:hypothetical protein